MVAGGESPTRSSRTPRAPRLWALASGKGGAGKSLLTANLASLLAESDVPTTAVDLDFAGANLHTYLGVDATGPGLDGVLDRRAALTEVVEAHDLPGLSLVRGRARGGEVPGRAERARLLRALRGLPGGAVVLDLASGAGPGSLDFFLGADVPLLVVTPEPAAVENAHRFLRAAWWGLLEQVARPMGQARRVEGLRQRLEHGARGAERAAVGREAPELLEAWERASAALRPGLVMNDVRHEQDVDVGFGIVSAVRQYFGVRMVYAGAVAHDPQAWIAARRRKLLRRDLPDELLTAGLAQIADRVIEGGELTPSHPHLPLFTPRSGDSGVAGSARWV